MIERKPLKVTMTQKIKLILLILPQQNENAHQVRIEKRPLASNVLKIINYLNLKKCISLILPRTTVDGLDLNWNGETALVGGEQIKQRNITGERSGHKTHPA